jgi:hypothetical protein
MAEHAFKPITKPSKHNKADLVFGIQWTPIRLHPRMDTLPDGLPIGASILNLEFYTQRPIYFRIRRLNL